MGMFTSITHPKDGRELQIKTGDDMCETYKIGDEVSFYVDKDHFGRGGIFDGVYSSYSDKGEDDWVVIKGHKVVAVHSRRRKIESLIKEYKIKGPSKTLWTKKAYAEYVALKKQVDEEYTEFKKGISNLPVEQQLGAILAYPLRRRQNYDGLIRKALSVTPLTVPTGLASILKKDKK